MTAVPIATHVGDAVARLLQNVAGKPYLTGLLEAVAQQVQDIEDGLQTLSGGLSLPLAIGAQLDAYGTLVGVSRNGLDDDAYRALLAGTIGSNFSDGGQAVLLDALSLLFQSDAIFKKDPNSIPGASAQDRGSNLLAYGVGSPAISPDLLATAVETFKRAIPAGFGLYYLSRFDAAGAFAFAGPQRWVKGFGDVNDPSVGGKMAGLIFSDPLL